MTKDKGSGAEKSLMLSELLSSLSRLDAQVQRELQRTPAQRSASGVQHWEPVRTRVEQITGALLQGFADQEIGLDPLLILAQASSKALQMLSEELGEAGLGSMRASYVRETFKTLERDAAHALLALGSKQELC